MAVMVLAATAANLNDPQVMKARQQPLSGFLSS
mgnify:FL=1